MGSNYIFPKASRLSVIRIILVIVVAYVVFGHIFIPLKIVGHSMEPTYMDGDFNFCNRLSYVLGEPERSDVVTVRFAGHRVMLLKRIIAFSGETVEFHNGVLYINGQGTREAYVKHKSDWNLPKRTVEQGKVYVIGDNRGVPLEQHKFGQVSIQRIVGTALW